MSDISPNLDTNKFCFADDTRLFKSIYDNSDASTLQSDLSKVYTSVNNMLFNDSKFTHISYKNSSNELIINSVSTKDLGITVSEDLQFSKHIKELARRCRQLSGWIQRRSKGGLGGADAPECSP